MEPLLVFLIVFGGVFTQSVAGFGVALITMAFLPGVIGIRQATPLVAILALLLEAFLLLRYRQHLQVGAIWRVVLASIVGIPLGIWFLKGVNEQPVLLLLGVLIAGYALYALLDIRLPQLQHPAWAYGAGLVAGLIGGAYNTSGPPVIIYGSCRRWPPAEFKSNMQGFFLINSIFVVAGHAWSGSYTPTVWSAFLWAVPALALGLLAGISLDGRLDPAAFRRLALWLLLFMGLRLALSAL